MGEFLNTTQSYKALLEKANQIQAACKDYKVPVTNLRLDDELNLCFDDQSMPLSQLAASHLCGKLGVPSRYYNKLVETGNLDLARDNINRWTKDDKRSFFVRSYDGKARGILSGSYSQFDAPDILKEVSNVFEPGKFVMKGSFINEERLHLRLIQTDLMPVDNEDLYAGISLDSSDVGRCGLYVRFFIWKKVCTNDLVIAKSGANLFSQKHIGITPDEFKLGLHEGLQNMEDLKNKIAEQITATSKIPMEKDMEKLIKQIKDATLLSDDMAQKVVEVVETKYAPTRWGLINGITEVAQNFELERRLQLEEMAAGMLVG